jgi:alpha-galactosidase
MMLDPLVGAILNPPQIWQLVDEMLVAQAQWLPQYKRAIATAKKRLETGPLLPTLKNYLGAARVKTKTVAQLRRDRVMLAKSRVR